MTQQVVTANRLSDGDVVYLAQEAGWIEWLDDAAVACDEAAAEALMQAAERAVDARHVVNPYLMAVAAEDNHVHPVNARERIRARGPSVRLDLGKQAAER